MQFDLVMMRLCSQKTNWSLIQFSAWSNDPWSDHLGAALFAPIRCRKKRSNVVALNWLNTEAVSRKGEKIERNPHFKTQHHRYDILASCHRSGDHSDQVLPLHNGSQPARFPNRKTIWLQKWLSLHCKHSSMWITGDRRGSMMCVPVLNRCQLITAGADAMWSKFRKERPMSHQLSLLQER